MKLRSLTIGRRIAAGFAAVLFIFCVVAVITRIALKKSGQGLDQYSASTAETNLVSQMEASMLSLRMDVNEYLVSGSDSALAAYDKEQKALQNVFAQSSTTVTDPERSAELSDAQKLFTQYDKAFRQIVQLRNLRNQEVSQVLDPKSAEMIEALKGMLASARQSGDMSASFKTSSALQSLFEGLTAVNSFHLTSDPAIAAKAKASFTDLEKEVAVIQKELKQAADLDASLADPAKMKLLAKLLDDCHTYVASFDKVVSYAQQRNDLVNTQLDKLAPQFASKIQSVRESVGSLQTTIGDDTKTAQSRFDYLVLIVTVIGVGLGVIGAIWIVRSVTKPIMRISKSLAEDAEQTAAAAGQVTNASRALADGAS